MLDQQASQTILLVDDDPLILELAGELLARLGFRVAAAGEASQALAVFHSLKKVDLAILDYHLAGEDGYQLLQDLRSLDPEMRVLIASGFLAAADESRLRQAGVQGIIYKPFRLKELQRSIQTALASGSGP